MNTNTVWEIVSPKIKLNTAYANIENYILSIGNISSGLLSIIHTQYTLRCSIRYGSWLYDKLTLQLSTQTDLTLNDELIVKFTRNGNDFKVYYKKNDSNWILGAEKAITDSLSSLDAKYLYFGTYVDGSGSPFLSGSIDLKQFSITVNGKEIFNGLMESTKPIYDKIASTNTALSTFQTDTGNNFSAVNSALNEKANLSDLANYVSLTTYNALLARVEALETEINGGNA